VLPFFFHRFLCVQAPTVKRRVGRPRFSAIYIEFLADALNHVDKEELPIHIGTSTPMKRIFSGKILSHPSTLMGICCTDTAIRVVLCVVFFRKAGSAENMQLFSLTFFRLAAS